jgi:hypothetical protein
MKIIITESQFKLISELDRNWMDAEYEGQYDKIKGVLIPAVEKIFVSYSENDNRIHLYNKKNVEIAMFNELSGELFYDKSIDDKYSAHFPHPIWLVNKKYLMADVFESLFPNKKVTRVVIANFG